MWSKQVGLIFVESIESTSHSILICELCFQTNFELATRVPFIVRQAGQTVGNKVGALVESVDLYPTVASLAGLPPPPDVDGSDLSPMMMNGATASQSRSFTVKPVDAAFSEFPRCAPPTAPW